MKVRITDLPQAGLTIHEELPLEPLNARMKEGSLGSDIVFTASPKAVLIIKPVITGAEAHGEVIARISQPCGRCIEAKEREITAVVAYSLAHIEPTDGDDSYDSELGFIKVIDGHVDFDEDLYQALISEINLFWNPEMDCNGKCSLCHKVFAEFKEPGPKQGRMLGALLDQALKKK
jgi:hypothetical protein